MADDLVQDWRVQATINFAPYSDVRVRADDFEELGELLKQVTSDVGASLANAATTLGLTVSVGQQLGGDQPVAGATQTTTQQQSGPPKCAHGARTFRKAKPDASNQWQAFFCPTPKGTANQCEPIFKGKDNETEPYWP